MKNLLLKFTIPKFITSLILIIFAVSLFMIYKVLQEKSIFHDRFTELMRKGRLSNISKNESFYATESQVKDPSESQSGLFNEIASFNYTNSISREGFSVIICDYLSTYPEQINIREFSFRGIRYFEKEKKTEYQYEMGEFNYDIYGFNYNKGGFKEKVVDAGYLSPNIIYQSCLDYYTKELKLNEKTETEDLYFEIYESLNENLKYYNINFVNTLYKDEIQRSEFGNKKFIVDVVDLNKRMEAEFYMYSFINDILSFILAISAVPAILLFFSFWIKYSQKKYKFIIIWIMFNYLLLILSSNFNVLNDKYIYGMTAYKTIWPFNSEIIKKQNKQILLGEDFNTNASFTQYMEEKIIVGFTLLDGYDYTEFILYSFCGLIIFIGTKKRE